MGGGAWWAQWGLELGPEEERRKESEDTTWGWFTGWVRRPQRPLSREVGGRGRGGLLLAGGVRNGLWERAGLRLLSREEFIRSLFIRLVVLRKAVRYMNTARPLARWVGVALVDGRWGSVGLGLEGTCL